MIEQRICGLSLYFRIDCVGFYFSYFRLSQISFLGYQTCVAGPVGPGEARAGNWMLQEVQLGNVDYQRILVISIVTYCRPLRW